MLKLTALTLPVKYIYLLGRFIVDIVNPQTPRYVRREISELE